MTIIIVKLVATKTDFILPIIIVNISLQIEQEVTRNLRLGIPYIWAIFSDCIQKFLIFRT